MMDDVLIFITITRRLALAAQTVSWGGLRRYNLVSSVDSYLFFIASAPPISREVLLLYLDFHLLLMQLFQGRCLQTLNLLYTL